MKKRILIIDDDPDMCTLLNRFLTRNGYEAEEAHTGQKGIEKYKQEYFDIVLCDYRLGDKEGKEVLEIIKSIDPNAIVIIITGYSDIETAVEVIKSGAYDYITKPLVPDEVLSVLNELAREAALHKNTIERTTQQNLLKDTDTFIAGQSKQSKELHRLVEIVSQTDYSVILYGESGTGKEVVARTIHKLSKRKDNPFIAMDCGTLSKELAGSELFGHIKGAFTGAINDKEGHFELANGGTLFLDEVSNLPYDIQSSLLRVIQERRFRKVGGNKEIPLDIRIIVASNENLQDAYKKRKFREDLYHRFNEFSIHLPRLANRKEDISVFAEYFLQKISNELNKTINGFEEEVMQTFMDYSWPGNLRELRNVIRRAALLCDTNKIDIDSLPFEIVANDINAGFLLPEPDRKFMMNMDGIKKENYLTDVSARVEYEAILRVLQQVNFNKSKAAELLNIDRKTLYNKIRSYEENLSGSRDSNNS